MNRAPPEMLHCLHMPENLAGNGTDMTVLERQQTRLKWQQQQQQQKQSQNLLQENYFNETHFSNLPLLPSTATQQFEGLMMNNESMIRELGNRSIKGDPSLENGWPDFENYPIPRNGFGGETIGFVSNEMVDFSISRTLSCPPVVEDKGREKLDSMVGKESFKKRKADKAQNPKVVVSEDMREKRIKGDTEEESKITEPNKNANTTTNNNNRETSGDTSKENNNSNVSGVQKPDYIHVRARRGQATDSHSLAERVRREKISERMKYLQDLVPGCNKITGKAGMLDEIINYVQSLQRQVEFLSMKLAAVNPRLDFNIENFFVKEMFPPCTNSFPTIGAMSSEMANCSAYLQFNQLQQIVSSCGLDLAINSPEMALRRSTSAPVSVPETFMDTSGFNQGQTPPTWETDLQSLYNMEFNQGRPTTFPPQSFTGTLEANNLKMEM